MDETPDVWKLAAIASFSVLAVVLVSAALIIGVMVHRRKSHKRPLRGEHERARVCYTPKVEHVRFYLIISFFFLSLLEKNVCEI